MTAPNFSAGQASDALINITCPGIKVISMTGRELRRQAEREAKAQKRQAQKAQKGGF